MALKKLTGTTKVRRFMTGQTFEEVTRKEPLKILRLPLSQTAGRDVSGHISTRHKGHHHKRFYRLIDFKRDKFNVPAKVAAIEYDPNRSSFIAQLNYADGEKRYITAPLGLEVGEGVVSGEKVEAKVGNTMPLKNMPIGTIVHNVEITPGKGGKIVRSAGNSATLQALDGGFAILKLPSGEVRKVSAEAMATVGVVSNQDWKNIHWGKAGRMRHRGIKPTVRGVAMSPRDHPHGGGEGKSGIGMASPKSPWGKPTMGKRTRKRKRYSDKLIIKRRTK